MTADAKPCTCCGQPVEPDQAGAVVVIERLLTPSPDPNVPGQLVTRELRAFCSRRHLAEWLRHPSQGPAGVVDLDPSRRPPERPALRLVTS